MKCNHCKKEASSGSIIPGYGFACSDECFEALNTERKTFHGELAEERIDAIPDSFDVPSFERFVLKISVHFLRALSDVEKEHLNPMFLIPEELALDLKDRILRHIKPAYVSECEVRGHARMFYGGNYMFRRPVPAKHVIEACRAAELIN